MPTRVLLALCVATWMTLLVRAEPSPQDQAPVPPQGGASPPVFRSSVEASHVDVTVLDRNDRPVSDLTVGDFQLLTGGQRQEITTFARVVAPAVNVTRPFGVVESDVSANTGEEGRLYVFALDEVEASLALRTRYLLRQFIENYFGVNDVGAVVHLGRSAKSSGQEFTSSRQRLLAAIDKFSGGFTAEENPAQDPDTLAAERDLAAINQLEALAAIVEFMAKLPAGRKALVLVTEGLRQVDVERTLNSRSNARALRDVCIRVDVDQRSCQPSQLLHRTLAAATHGNVVIYPIDPTGLTGGPRDYNLIDLAAATGGFPVASTNAFGEGFARIARDHGSYYLLGFEASQRVASGRTVPIEVRVTRADVTVQSRTSYVAPFSTERRLFAPPSGNPMSLAVASAVAAPGVPMRVAAVPFKGTEERASIMLLVGLDASGLRLVESKGKFEGRLQLRHVATGDGGKVYPGSKQSLKLSLQPATRARMLTSGLRLLTPLSLPAGRYQLRVAAGDDLVAGSVLYDLEVPDFRQPLSMSGVLLYSAAEETITVRATDAGAFPGNSTRNPTISREFARTDTVTVYTELYARNAVSPSTSVLAELFDASGRRVLTRATPLSAASPQGNGGRAVSIELPLSQVPQGAYALRVYVTGRRNEPSISRSLLVQVR